MSKRSYVRCWLAACIGAATSVAALAMGATGTYTLPNAVDGAVLDVANVRIEQGDDGRILEIHFDMPDELVSPERQTIQMTHVDTLAPRFVEMHGSRARAVCQPTTSLITCLVAFNFTYAPGRSDPSVEALLRQRYGDTDVYRAKLNRHLLYQAEPHGLVTIRP